MEIIQLQMGWTSKRKNEAEQLLQQIPFVTAEKAVYITESLFHRKNYNQYSFCGLGEKKMAGMLIAWASPEEEDTVIFGYIAVREDCREKGLAAQLLGALEMKAKECGQSRIVLSVWEENMQARHWYEKNGFQLRRQGKDICWVWKDQGNPWQHKDVIYEKDIFRIMAK